MRATPKNFKTTGKDEGPSPLNSMECGIFQLQHALRLRVMTNQVEHTVKVMMAKARKAA
jgi:hypothetical protein